MRGFLDEVAQRLYSKYGAEVSSLKLIFPSRRSRIFFTEALSSVAQEPLWQPEWLSLDDLVMQAVSLRHGESIKLISELYKIYSDYHAESFDKFYFWGEILLSDFDMIDKYMVDADMLFTNVADLKLIESDLSYMTPEQIEIITSFWRSIEQGGDLTREKQRFLKVWESLPKIYHRFRERLTELGIAYTGMIQRMAVEQIKAGAFHFDSSKSYAVVGFNALSECEKRLFDALARDCSVDFFWDYDNYYVDSEQQEAGLFIRENLARYGSQYDISHDNFKREKHLEVVAAASNVLQCKYASKIISELAAQGKVDKETAIVLTDENLLTPLLYALPKEAGKVNVTMGYPLKQSLAYSLIERLLALQSNVKGRKSDHPQFYHVDLKGLLAHPYVNVIDKDLFAQIGKSIELGRMISVPRSWLLEQDHLPVAELLDVCDTWQELSQYLLRSLSFVARHPYAGEDSMHRLEFLATISQSISSLHNSLEGCSIELSRSIYISLLRRMLQTLRVPFEGEPLEGLQVMGILETRNLDFKRVIILSMNDDSFPGNRLTSPSYVPYSLRAAYGVPTPEHHEGVYAYYFYRLVQRAQSVWMLYCSHADDKTTGEASRYIYQLDYESGFDIARRNVGVDVNLYGEHKIEVEKCGHVDAILSQYTDSESPLSLSPSAINRYIACPLRFYFQHIAHIKSSNELSEDVDNSMFGNILHEAVCAIYKPYVGREDLHQCLEELLVNRNLVEDAAVAAIRSVCKIADNIAVDSFAGDLILIKDIVVKYILDGVVSYDVNSAPFSVEGVEKEYSYNLALPSGESVLLKGTLDRVDRLPAGRLRVVDYKTGGNHLEFRSIRDLFEGKASERQGHILQTLTYSMMLHRALGSEVVPSLYYVRFMHNPTYSPLLIDKSSGEGAIATYSDKSEEFEQYLCAKLSELFDRSIPFRQAEDKEGSCLYCDFREICRV